MDRGWVKLWRKSLDSGMLRNSDLWTFWTWCLMKATRHPAKTMVGFQEVELEPGQLIFGRKAAAEELKMSEQTIRTCLKNLEKSKNLTIKSTNKFSVISITNWDIYQSSEIEINHQTNQRLTINSPSTNHKQEVKKLRSKELNTLSASGDADQPHSTAFYLTKKKRKLTGKRLETFELFWKAFAYPKGKAEAADAWMDIPELRNGLVAEIVEAAEKEAANRHKTIAAKMTPKWAQGWISGRRWEDQDFKESTCWDDV